MIVRVESCDLVVEDRSVFETGIDPGEFYVAKRNRPWQLLTAERIVSPEGATSSWVEARERAYSFDTTECFKVVGLPGEQK